MKKIFCTLFLAISAALSAEPDNKIDREKVGGSIYKIIEDKAGLTIATPSLAERSVRKLRLDNGLEALLISDPETHESGAGLAVAVGSWDDPEDRPGMAHFVEHMLFLGTEKYPEEQGYTRYLDEHGGNRNAFTMADRTVYMFSVNNDAFLGALDRFGQFFISPLFSPSGVDRECKAIHSEFCKNIPLDPWRVLFVKKELANSDHPFHAFSIGNKESLAQISQDELKEWYRTHYSANLMHLVVYSSEDLDTLEKEISALFSAVKNKHREPSHFAHNLKIKEQEQKLCVITPVQEVQSLELSWEIPRFFGQDRTLHTDKLLSHVLGHEGASSLLAQLKRENLAEGLGVGNVRAGHDQCFLTLSVQLTDQGVEQYEEVITRCFEAIAAIRKSGIPKYVFEEVSHLEEMRYRFQSRTEIFDFVSDYATNMVEEPLETYPRQTLIPSIFAPQKIKELIACLTPEECLYTLVADPSLTKVSPTSKEKWLGAEYTQIPINSEKIKAWAKVAGHQAISIPRPNPFIPRNWEVKNSLKQEKPSLLPETTIIADEASGCIYASSDQQFLVPEISWTFHIETPEISEEDPLSYVYADLYCHTVSENLNAVAYEALTAGLSFSLAPKEGGLELKVRGYSDKAAPFFKTIATEMKSACPSKEQFELYSASLARDYTNSLNASPLKQGGELLSSILHKHFPGMEQKTRALSQASYPEMKQFCNALLKRSYIQGTLFGNQTPTEAKELWNSLKTIFASQAYPPSEHPNREMAQLPAREVAAYICLNSEQPANALILATDCGYFEFKRRAAQEILTKGLEEPFFSELRTRQQTAYLVTNWSQEMERHLYSFFAIQSSSHDARDLLARFELFLENSLQHLEAEVIPEERFESIKSALVEQLEHPAENLAKMGSLLHLIACDYDADFHWTEKRIQAYKELTYPEFLDYAHHFIGKENKRRVAIAVNGILPDKGGLSYQEIDSLEAFRKEISYEGRQEESEQKHHLVDSVPL